MNSSLLHAMERSKQCMESLSHFPLRMAGMPDVKAMTAVLGHPQGEGQSEDRQAEYKVEDLKPTYQGKSIPHFAVDASCLHRSFLCFIEEYSALTSLSYHSELPSSHRTITVWTAGSSPERTVLPECL